LTDDGFPDFLDDREGISYPLYYQYAPGERDDGVTLACDLDYLDGLPDSLGTWLVPGYRHELVTTLLKALPKFIRSQLAPITRHVNPFLEREQPTNQTIYQSLANYLTPLVRDEIKLSYLEEAEIPPHLRMHYWIGDASGNEVAFGDHLEALRQRLGKRLKRHFEEKARIQEETKLKEWPRLDPIPETLTVDPNKNLNGFPGLKDEGRSVSLKISSNREEADWYHRRGLIRLLSFQLPDLIAHLRQRYPMSDESRMMLPLLGQKGQSEEELLWITLDKALETGSNSIRNRAAFDAAVQRVNEDLFVHAEQIGTLLDKVIAEYQVISRWQADLENGPYADSLPDIEAQIHHLFGPRFLTRAWWDRFRHYPRYLQGLRFRLEQLPGQPPIKDLKKIESVQGWQEILDFTMETAATRSPVLPEALLRFGWQVEDFRLTVFAPGVPPLEKTSAKKLGKSWERLCDTEKEICGGIDAGAI
ncbi:MAG: DUF3418 domain-containing protein, partial [Verrucomicrobiota bacterium]